MEDLWPIYEFRPLPKTEALSDLMRYVPESKEWIPDDGEHGRAFCSNWDQTYWYVSLPYQKNTVWSWCKNHQWGAMLMEHPQSNGNAWHYMLREGETEWGGDWGRHKHPNSVSFDDLPKPKRIGNGRHVEFHIMDSYILRGLLRREDTQEAVVFPEVFECMYCGPRRWKEEDDRWEKWVQSSSRRAN